MCTSLGFFTVGNASPTGLCSGPFPIEVFGNSLTLGEYLYTDPSCTTLLGDNLYYSNGNTYYDVAGCCAVSQRISYTNDTDFTAGIRHVSYRTRVNTTPNREIFKNTVSQVDSGANSTNTVTWNDATSATIGNNWYGRLYSFRAYSRPLTDTEMVQNYDAQKERFGLATNYYNCGYGCQGYNYNPGCTAC